MRKRKPRGLREITEHDVSSLHVYDGVTLNRRRVFSMKIEFGDEDGYHRESIARLLRSDAKWLHAALTEWLRKGQKKKSGSSAP